MGMFTGVWIGIVVKAGPLKSYRTAKAYLTRGAYRVKISLLRVQVGVGLFGIRDCKSVHHCNNTGKRSDLMQTRHS